MSYFTVPMPSYARCSNNTCCSQSVLQAMLRSVICIEQFPLCFRCNLIKVLLLDLLHLIFFLDCSLLWQSFLQPKIKHSFTQTELKFSTLHIVHQRKYLNTTNSKPIYSGLGDLRQIVKLNTVVCFSRIKPLWIHYFLLCVGQTKCIVHI